MSKPLNDLLYRRLKTRFGSVRITAEGQAFVGHYVLDVLTNNEKLNIVNPGEYYQVNCPRCRDTKHRLWINHMWGKTDERGNRNLWLAICYNEGCFAGYEAKKELFDELTSPFAPLERARIDEGIVVREAPETRMPGPHYPLHKLPKTHPANVYLAGRHYDTEKLGKFWGWGYCPDSIYSLARNRIVAPIMFNGKLCGWQARMIGEYDPRDLADPETAKTLPPKWWSDPNMKKSLLLYNFHNAIRCKTGVVVEGPGDAVQVGPAGMATLGSSVSDKQIDLLRFGFKDHSVVWLWDPDVQKDPKKVKHMEKQLPKLRANVRGGVAVVWLPDGTDPGKLDREFIHDYITREARDQGVRVNLGLR